MILVDAVEKEEEEEEEEEEAGLDLMRTTRSRMDFERMPAFARSISARRATSRWRHPGVPGDSSHSRKRATTAGNMVEWRCTQVDLRIPSAT